MSEQEIATSTIRIREASVGDSGAAAALVTQLGYPTSSLEMRERLMGILSDDTYRTFVAETPDVILGLAGGRLGRYFEKNEPHAQIVILVVSPDAHGSGVGTSLLQAVETWAASQGAREIVVNSGQHRDQAHRFYEARGFRPTGLRFIKALA